MWDNVFTVGGEKRRKRASRTQQRQRHVHLRLGKVKVATEGVKPAIHIREQVLQRR